MIEESVRQGAERAKREVHHGVPRCLLKLRDRTDAHTELDGEQRPATQELHVELVPNAYRLLV